MIFSNFISRRVRRTVSFFAISIHNGGHDTRYGKNHTQRGLHLFTVRTELAAVQEFATVTVRKMWLGVLEYSEEEVSKGRV